MCHDIEDPTFDATAAATNPKMTMRPIHRPPRVDGDIGNGADRWPHCRWIVSIGEDNQPYEQHPNLAIVEDSEIASIPLDLPEADGEPGGRADYSGPFDPHCVLADWAHRPLVGLVQEFAVQAHILCRSYIVSQAANFGAESAEELAWGMWIGHAAAGRSASRTISVSRATTSTRSPRSSSSIPTSSRGPMSDLHVEITGEDRLPGLDR